MAMDIPYRKCKRIRSDGKGCRVLTLRKYKGIHTLLSRMKAQIINTYMRTASREVDGRERDFYHRSLYTSCSTHSAQSDVCKGIADLNIRQVLIAMAI